MQNKKVGLLGCGTIGSELAIAVDTGSVANASLASLFDIAEDSIQRLASKLQSNPNTYLEFGEFISSNIDVVVETASQAAVRKFGRKILEAGKDMMIMSVGALAQGNILSEFLQIGSTPGGRTSILASASVG